MSGDTRSSAVKRYHPDVAAFVAQFQAAALPPLSSGTPADARKLLESLRPARSDAPPLEHVEDVQIPSDGATIGARIYEPQGGAKATIVYLHGGGWVMGNLDTSDFATRHLCAATGARVVSIDYRLAPEHPFPDPLLDAEAGLAWAVQRYRGTGPIIIAGDSAGANLAAVVAIRARDAGQSGGIDAQLLIYPVTDCDLGRQSYADNGEAPPLTTDDMRWFWTCYAPDQAGRGHPHLSPLRADLGGLPRTLIAVAEYDPLLDDGVEYARKLDAAGVQVELRTYEGAVHGFFTMPDRLAPARALLEDCRVFTDRVIDDWHRDIGPALHFARARDH